MSKCFAELCTLLVEEIYGGLASKVFSTLARHGRLTLEPLCHYANLPPRSVRHGLVVLLQQNLLCYCEGHTTFYEVNLQNAYDLVRLGKTITLVESNSSKDVGVVITNLQVLGYAGASNIVPTRLQINGHHRNPPEKPAPHSVTNGGLSVNGPSGKITSKHNKIDVQTSNTSAEDLKQAFSTRYVEPVRETDFMPEAEFNAEIERIVQHEEYDDAPIAGTKMVAEFRRAVLQRKNRWKSDDRPTLGGMSEFVRPSKTPRGSKAPVEASSRKRRKLMGGTDDRADGDRELEHVNNPGPHRGEKSKAAGVNHNQDDLLLRINRNKLNVSFRTQRLVDLSARCLGDTTSKVYAALLRQMEHHIPRCHDEYSEPNQHKDIAWVDLLPSVTNQEVLNELNPAIDLSSIIPFTTNSSKANPECDGSDKPHDKAGNEIFQPYGRKHVDDETTSHGTVDRKKQSFLVDQHLRLLAEDPHAFVDVIGRNSWKVDFPALTRDLVQFELENVIAARFGNLATRVVRILYKKGKLDEKQLASFGLLRAKELRATLTAMQEAGYVETQEVPRDNTRQPSRTLYLWFFDQDRCRELVLHNTYKGMARLLQRTKVEKEKVQAVINKAERTDVKGHEDEYLTKAERAALVDWDGMEEKLLVQLGRQDDLVALLRDFLPSASV